MYKIYVQFKYFLWILWRNKCFCQNCPIHPPPPLLTQIHASGMVFYKSPFSFSLTSVIFFLSWVSFLSWNSCLLLGHLKFKLSFHIALLKLVENYCSCWFVHSQFLLFIDSCHYYCINFCVFTKEMVISATFRIQS